MSGESNKPTSKDAPRGPETWDLEDFLKDLEDLDEESSEEETEEEEIARIYAESHATWIDSPSWYSTTRERTQTGSKEETPAEDTPTIYARKIARWIGQPTQTASTYT